MWLFSVAIRRLQRMFKIHHVLVAKDGRCSCKSLLHICTDNQASGTQQSHVGRKRGTSTSIYTFPITHNHKQGIDDIEVEWNVGEEREAKSLLHQSNKERVSVTESVDCILDKTVMR